MLPHYLTHHSYIYIEKLRKGKVTQKKRRAKKNNEFGIVKSEKRINYI